MKGPNCSSRLTARCGWPAAAAVMLLALGAAQGQAAEPAARSSMLQEVAASPAAPLSVADATALLRTGQLIEWLNEPLTLANSLCIQAAYLSTWPKAAQGPSNDRQEELLRQAREQCGNASDGRESSAGVTSAAPATRLIAVAREDFKAMLLRLHGPQLAIRSCRQASPDAAVQGACLRQVMGREISVKERDWLLAAAGGGKP